MSSNKHTTFTIDINTNITNLLKGTEQAKNAISNIFNTGNLGQSLLGDFNKLNKILTRIQNTASGPIRSEWGAENLIADFSRADTELDEMISKLEEIKKNKDLRINILDDNEIKDFQTALDYSKKLGEQLKENEKIQAEITRLSQEQTKDEEARFEIEKKLAAAKKDKSIAQGQLTRIRNKYGIQEYTKEAYETEWKALASQWGLMQKNMQFNNAGAALGLSKDLLKVENPNLINIKAVMDSFKKTDENGKEIQRTKEEIEQLNKIEEKLRTLNNLKQKYFDFKAKSDAFAKAEKEVEVLQGKWDSLDKSVKDYEALINTNKGNFSNTFNTQEWKDFEVIAQRLGVDISNITEKSGIDQIQEKINLVHDAIQNKAVVGVDNLITHLGGLRQANKATQTSTNDLIDAQRKQNQQMNDVEAIANRIKYFTGFYGIMRIIRKAVNNALTTIKELDEQMTKMAVVTDPTVGDYWKRLPEYTKRANALGAAIKEVYEADTLYYQQGLKTNQVMQVSNETMKMARIASLNAAEATDRMTSAMRGFNMEINQASAQRVNDVYSQLAAITASDVNEISVAMTKTASIAHSAGMEFETTAAFLSQIIETTRESADTAGTALKTIIARFEELKKSPSEIGEIDGEVVDANKIETALRSVGIALRDTQGQFRDLDDVFLELASKWDSLDKNTQRYIATIAAGSRQQSRFIAMMQNYAHTTDLVAKANNSAGASQKQFEKTLDSMKTKLNALENAWNTFSMGILESNTSKFVLETGTKIIELLNSLTKTIDKMGGSFVGAAARVGILVVSLRTLGKVGRVSLAYLTGKGIGVKGGLAAKINNGLVATPADGSASQQVGLIQAITNLGAYNRSKKAYAATMAQNGQSTMTGAQVLTQNASGLKNFASGLGSIAIKLGVIAAIIGAIIGTIAAIASIVKSIKFNSQEEVFKRDREALDNYKNSVEELKNSLDDINVSSESYSSLVSEMEDLVIGTDEWKEKLVEVNKEVLNLIQEYPKLAKYVQKDMFGMFTIDQSGFDQLAKEQEKAILNLQKEQLKQQVKVNNNTRIERREEIIKTFNITGEQYYDLSKLDQESLLEYLESDMRIQNLSSELNLNASETVNLITSLIENREVLDENNASIDALSASIDQLNPDTNMAAKARMSYTVDKDLAESIRSGLREGSDYINNQEYQKRMSELAKEYGLGDWRETLKELGYYESKYESEQLAVLYGLSMGITDFQTSIDRYTEKADKAFFGIWARERKTMEQEIGNRLADRDAQKKAQENAESKSKEEQDIINKILSGKLNLLTKEEFESLQANNFQKAKDLQNEYGNLGNAEYFDKLAKFISVFSNFDELVEKAVPSGLSYSVPSISKEVLGAISKLQGDFMRNYEVYSKEEKTMINNFKSFLRDKGYNPDMLTTEKVKELASDFLNNYESLEEDRKRAEQEDQDRENRNKKDFTKQFTELDTLPFLVSEKLKKIFNDFTEGFSGIDTTQSAQLADTIRKMYYMQGEEGAQAYLDALSAALENIDPKDINDFLSAVFSGFDPSSLDWIESLNSALKQKNGNVPWIDTFTNQMKDLGEATRKVELKTLTEQIVEFANTLQSIKLGEFKNTFTKEQYEKMLKQGFDPNAFIMNNEGNYLLKGGAEAYEKGMDSYFKSMTDETHKAIVASFEKNEEFNNFGSKDDYKKQTSYYNSYTGLGNESEDLRQFILENAHLIGQPVYDVLSATTDQLKEWLQLLINKRDEYKTVVDSPEYKNRQILLEQQYNTGHLSSSQYLFENGNFDKDRAWALYNNLYEDENIDKSKVDKLREYIEIMENGGEEAEAIKKDFQELASELGAHSALSKSFNIMSKSMSNITSKLDFLDEGVVDSLSDVKDVEEALNGLGITLPQIYDELDDLEKMKITQNYAELLKAYSEGSEEAYQGIIDLIVISSEDGFNALKELQTESLEEWSEYATDLAYILQRAGMGTIMDNAFKFWNAEDLLKAAEDAGKDKDKKKNPWENPYDWLWNITEQINKTLYQRERLERKYKLAVEDTAKSAEDLYNISKKELDNLQEQARLQSLKGQKATEEAQLLLSNYKEYAKYVSMNPLTGQVQVAYEELDKKGWSQEQGSAFEAFVSRLTELANEIKESNKSLEEIEDEVKEIQLRGKQELIDLQNRVKDALVTEREREIETLEQVNDAITNQQSKLLDAMRDEIDETRRIRENTDKQEEIEKKRQKLAYLQRDTSGANQTEILSLQEEIEKDTLSYGDALIDQSLQKMQEDNELAAEKRQEQIDIANFQLAKWTESGAIWETVGPLLENFFDNDGGKLKELISDAETWQELSKLERENMEEEFDENGKLAKLFNDGNLYNAAKGTLEEVQSQSNILQTTLEKTGALGNDVLDLGDYLRVTLKDYNPKEDDSSSGSGKTLGDIKKTLDNLYQYLKDYILPKSTGVGNPAGKADLITGIEQNLSRYGRSRAELEVKIGEKLDGLSVNQLSVLTTFLNEKKYDLDNKESLEYIRKYKKYATGGLNTQTGPAWLDGTPSKPEYVLNSDQTRAFFNLVNGVDAISKSNGAVSGGDNYFNVEVNVDEISNDYDVDRAIERVKQAIFDDSQYRNVNFISGFAY